MKPSKKEIGKDFIALIDKISNDHEKTKKKTIQKELEELLEGKQLDLLDFNKIHNKMYK